MLKGYWQFYREMDEFIDDEHKNLTIEDVNEAFQDLIDTGYRIEMLEYLSSDLVDMFEGSYEGVEKILTTEEYHVCYDIVIRDVRSNPFKGDLTDDFLTGIEVIESLGVVLIDKSKPLPKGYENVVMDDIDTGYSFTPVGDITLKDGHISDDTNKLGQVSVMFAEPSSRKFTPKEIAERMKWKDYGVYDNGKGIYIDISKEDLVDALISSSHDYYSTLKDGIDYDNYMEYSYQHNPDTNSLFQYSLDDENSILLVKSIIKEGGGVDEIISELDLEDEIPDNSEESLIRFFISERNWDKLDELDSEQLGDVKRTFGDWSSSSQASETEEAINNAFEKEMVSEEIGFDKKFTTEVEKSYSRTADDGGSVIEKYKETVWMYRLMYCDEWVEDIDMSYFKEDALENLFYEFAGNIENINPSTRLPEYGSPDDKRVNVEVKSELEAYLKN
jgi:hypothetical protein